MSTEKEFSDKMKQKRHAAEQSNRAPVLPSQTNAAGHTIWDKHHEAAWKAHQEYEAMTRKK